MNSYQVKNAIRRTLRIPHYLVGRFRSAGKQKIFCIGCNKTGTTSLKVALKELGYFVGDQRTAELIAECDWPVRDFKRLIKYCSSAQAFQDAPFSFPDTFEALDRAFPNSRFILTVRDSSEQWYRSITKFHSKLWGDGKSIPSADDLKGAFCHFRGRPWRMNRVLFDTPEDDPYQKEGMIRYYENHNASVQEYFKDRPEDLLILNVAEPQVYRKLCSFLNKPCDNEDFPWENKT